MANKGSFQKEVRWENTILRGLLETAQKGESKAKIILFSDEIEKVKDLKLEVKAKNIAGDIYDVYVSWENALRGKMDLNKSMYISCWHNNTPKTDSFAEMLALETLRSIAKQQMAS